ncbi:MAG: cobalamin biosynthesis protein CbiX [Candidatus Hydrogenedentes bacterium]|nr:cobalamin biosynthesis protein CbiX [Candidatus Hydrogenedentota bacterium]
MQNLPRDYAVILVDHGSTYAAANEMLEQVARNFGDATRIAIVEPAHMEIAEPTIAQAFAKCVARGAKRVIIHPYFLSPGVHSTTDIPCLVAEAAADFPSVPFCVSEPIGIDPRMNEVVLRRVLEAVRWEGWEE